MDDLTQLKGVGKALSAALVTAGLDSFAGLAALTDEQVAALPTTIDFAGRDPDWPNIVEQARELAPPADPKSETPAEAAAPGAGDQTGGGDPNPASPPAQADKDAPPEPDQGGAGDGAGPATVREGQNDAEPNPDGGADSEHETPPPDVSDIAGDAIRVTTKRDQRWRAGIKFTRAEPVTLPLARLSEAQYRAIDGDPALSIEHISAGTDH